MKEYYMHARYTLLHKWYVFEQCCKYGIPLQGLTHDLWKFTPEEFVAYAKYFFGPDGILWVEEKGGYFHSSAASQEERKNKMKCELKQAFNRAWNHHLCHSPHHWQYWVMIDTDVETKNCNDVVGGCQIEFSTEKQVIPKLKALKMPREYVLEMVADWIGAGKATNTPDTKAWYKKNKDRIILHPDTRAMVEELIGYKKEA